MWGEELNREACFGCVSGKRGATREVAGAVQGTSRVRIKIRAGHDGTVTIKTYFFQKFDKTDYQIAVCR
jgi:hypothetical protein